MEFTAFHVLAMIGATLAGILGVMYVVAASIRDATARHDVLVQARLLRIEFERKALEQKIGGAPVVIDDPEEPVLVV